LIIALAAPALALAAETTPTVAERRRGTRGPRPAGPSHRPV